MISFVVHGEIGPVAEAKFDPIRKWTKTTVIDSVPKGQTLRQRAKSNWVQNNKYQQNRVHVVGDEFLFVFQSELRILIPTETCWNILFVVGKT